MTTVFKNTLEGYTHHMPRYGFIRKDKPGTRGEDYREYYKLNGSADVKHPLFGIQERYLPTLHVKSNSNDSVIGGDFTPFLISSKLKYLAPRNSRTSLAAGNPAGRESNKFTNDNRVPIVANEYPYSEKMYGHLKLNPLFTSVNAAYNKIARVGGGVLASRLYSLSASNFDMTRNLPTDDLMPPGTVVPTLIPVRDLPPQQWSTGFALSLVRTRSRPSREEDISTDGNKPWLALNTDISNKGGTLFAACIYSLRGGVATFDSYYTEEWRVFNPTASPFPTKTPDTLRYSGEVNSGYTEKKGPVICFNLALYLS